MLLHSFLHVPGVGYLTEKKIWHSGIAAIDDFICSPPSFLSHNQAEIITKHLLVTRQKIQQQDAGYFYRKLPVKEHWRIFRDFQKTAAYLDIETTGLGGPGDMITTIALYDGYAIKYYVNGKNIEDFLSDITQYKIIITYNGKCFDIPFIERYFGIRLEHVHLDLRYILHDLGYRGGLKSCERQLGIGRTGYLKEVSGFFAVLLWDDYINNNNIRSLETLLAYNIEDTLSLEYLMIEAYNKRLNSISLPIIPVIHRPTPANLFEIDRDTVIRLRKRLYF